MYQSYYRPGYPKVRPSFKPSKPRADAQTWPAEVIWGAAAYAQRINGAYVKEDRIEIVDEAPVVTARSSKVIMRDAIADQSLISQEDLAIGRDARDWHKKNLLVKALKTQLNDFEQTVARVAGMDEFAENQRLEIAITASQIQSFIVNRQVAEAMSRVDTTAGHVGAVGAKVTCAIEVVRSVYSQNYNCFFVTGITEQNQPVFFSYRGQLQAGVKITVQGAVKAHRNDSTQLNRVKVIA